MDPDTIWPPQVRDFFVRHPQWLPSSPSDVPRGWDEIVANALAELDALRLRTGVGMTLAQVKEKFGDLRVYVEVDEASLEGLTLVEETEGRTRYRSGAKPGSVRATALQITDAAERQARKVCVKCGAPAVRQIGHYRFCGTHDRARDAS